MACRGGGKIVVLDTLEATGAQHAVLVTALAKQARAAGSDSTGVRRAATMAAD